MRFPMCSPGSFWLVAASLSLLAAVPCAAQPDLRVGSLQAPATAATGDSIPVSLTVRNAGDTGAINSLQAGLLVVAAGTTRVTTPQEFAVRVDLPPLLSGESLSVEARLPVTAAPGQVRVGAFVDPDGIEPESLEDNNDGVSAALTVVAPTANLVVESIQAPSSASLGDLVPLTYTVRNAGSGPARFDSVAEVVLSTDQLRDGNDQVLVPERSIPALAAGQSSVDEIQIRFPREVPAGSYFVLVRADRYSQLGETSETDNVRATPPTLLSTPTVNLSAAAVAAPAIVTQGRPFDVRVSVTNLGTHALEQGVTVSVVVTSALQPLAWEPAIGTVSLFGVAAGATEQVTISCRVDGRLSPGNYHLFALVDPEDMLGEVREDDNVRESASGLQLLRSDVDLAAAWDRVPAEVVIGSAFAARLAVTNRGAGNTPAGFHTGTFLGRSSQSAADDVQLGERYIESLAAGATTTVAVQSTVPYSVAPGAYFLHSHVDHYDVLVESDETNNRAVQALAARRSRIDLVAQRVLAPPSVARGSALPLYAEVENPGTDNSPAFTLSFFASPAPAVATDSVQLGGDLSVSGGLAAGQRRVEGPFFVGVPEELPAGAYYVVAQVDRYETVDQSDRTNDVVSSAGRMQVTSAAPGDDHPDSPGLVSAPRDSLPTDGTPVAATHERPNDRDFFRFSAAAGSQLVISVDGQPWAGVDTTLELLAPNGARLAFNDDFGSSARSRVGPVTAPAAGTYLVAVGESQLFGSGPYVVRAFVEAGRPDLAVSLSAPVPASVPQSSRLRTTVTVDNLGAARVLPGARVDLYLSRDSLVTTADVARGGFELPEVPAAGTVRFAVELAADRFEVSPGTWFAGAIADAAGTVPETNRANNAAVSPAVTVVAAEDDHPGRAALALEPGDRLLADGGPVAGRIERAGDVDFFRFPVTFGRDYSVTLRPGTLFQGVLTVYEDDETNGKGDLRSEASSEPLTVVFHADADTVAFVRVAPLDAVDTGSYTVELKLESDGTVDDLPNLIGDSPPLLPLVELRSAVIGIHADVDLFRVELADGVEYRFRLSPVNLPGLEVQMLDSRGSPVAPEEVSTGTGQPVAFSFTASATGPHFVRVAGRTAAEQGRYDYVYDLAQPPSMSLTKATSGADLLVNIDVQQLPFAIEAAQLSVQFDSTTSPLAVTLVPGPASAGLEARYDGDTTMGQLDLSLSPGPELSAGRAPANGRLVTLVLRSAPPELAVHGTFGAGNATLLSPAGATYTLYAPEADAGPYQAVQLRSGPQGQLLPSLLDPLDPFGPMVASVRLDGRRSANSGPFPRPLSYRWTVSSAPAPVTLTGDLGSTPAFTPSTAGGYTFALQVGEGSLASPPAFVTVDVGVAAESPSALPEAVEILSGRATGRDVPVLQTRAGASAVRLDGSGSFDPNPEDAGALAYRWNQTGGPTVVLEPSPADAAPVFSPPRPGLYEFTLTVTDPGGLPSLPRSVQVMATPGDAAPALSLRARASTNRLIGQALPLSRFDASDPSLRATLPTSITLEAVLAARLTTASDGPVQFRWQQVEGPQVALSSVLVQTDSPYRSVTEFQPTTARVYEFDCLAQELDDSTQPTGVQAVRRIRVVVDGPRNGVPLPVAQPRVAGAKGRLAGADAGPGAGWSLEVGGGAQVALDGSLSRDVGAGAAGQLAFRWTQLEGPSVLLSNPYSPVPTFVTPILPSRGSPLVFALYVDDGQVRSQPALAVVNVAAAGQSVGTLGVLPGVNFVSLPVAATRAGRPYSAADLASELKASLVARLTAGTAGQRFEPFAPNATGRGFDLAGNDGYVVVAGTSRSLQLAGPVWPVSALQRTLVPGLNLIALPRGVPAGFDVGDLAGLTHASFVVYNPLGGSRARTAVFVPGLTSGTPPAVEAGRAYLLSVPGTLPLSLPGN